MAKPASETNKPPPGNKEEETEEEDQERTGEAEVGEVEMAKEADVFCQVDLLPNRATAPWQMGSEEDEAELFSQEWEALPAALLSWCQTLWN